MAKKMDMCIEDLHFELLDHLLYNLDVAPTNFHLFVSLQEELRVQKFKLGEEFVEAVQERLHTRPKSYFMDKIQNLVKCWTKCIDVGSDYVANDHNKIFASIDKVFLQTSLHFFTLHCVF